jgi:PAS domain S-box-containing protein
MKSMPRDERVGAVLIVAPAGNDAALAARVLKEADVPSRICATVTEAAQEISNSTSGILLQEEALLASELRLVRDALRQQPRWSDIPVVILTTSGGSERIGAEALDLFGPSGNVTLLEQPLHRLTLVSAIKIALRARQRQFEVRELLEQREMLLSGISDAFSSLDHEWRYVYVNDRVAELAGVPKEQMIGRSIWEIFPEAVGTEFYRLAHVAMNERRPVQGEFFHKPWGRWLDTRIYPTKGGIVILRTDVTENKRREEQLRESEDLLRLATEAAGIGTFDYYPLSGKLRFSTRCKELFGLPPEAEVRYDTYYNAVHPEDRHIVHGALRDVLKPGRHRYAIEYRARGVEDGRERWLAEKGRAIVDESGRATRFIGTILDITERKNAELALERAKHEAEEANRAKDQFLAMLSHELRTPLTPVLMTIASLRRQPDVSDELRRDLEVLQRNVELEALLIDDLLDLTRIKYGKLELHNDATDIHGALDYALDITARDVQEKQLRLTRRYEAREYHCWADGARLQQVFWNLVKNAVKFTPPGGRIEVSTRNDREHNIIVEVTDTGIGIEADLLPCIFDAFEQGGRKVTSQFGGLGLGLAISKRVVDMHGGTIRVRSPGVGQGATFTVTLKAMETSLLEGPVFLPADEQIGAMTAVLLVEDHGDTARALRRVLEHAGYSVEHAESVARAKETAGKNRFHLVISDLGLPDGSGLDLMRHLRDTYGLPGIALSGFGTDEDREASAAAGFAVHLTKPVDWPELRDAVQQLVSPDGHRPLAEAAAS